MKAHLNAAEFYAAMKKVSGALRHSDIPPLEQIRVDFTGGVCRMTASDLNVWLSIEVPAKGDCFSFWFSDTAAAVRACRYFRGEMTVELTGGITNMKVQFCAGEKSGVFSAEGILFSPVSPSEDPLQHYVLNASALAERIKKIRYAALANDSKPALQGVRFDGNHVWCVDGNRIALNDDPSLTVERCFVLPAYALAHLDVFSAGATDLYVGTRYAWFSSANTRLLIRQLMPADKIRIEAAIPPHSAESYWVDREKLADAIGYLAGCSRGMQYPYVFFDGRKLILENRGFEYSTILETDGVSSVKFAFDINMMKDALKQFAGEKSIRINVSSKFAPIVLRSDGTNTALLMPVRMRAGSRWDAA